MALFGQDRPQIDTRGFAALGAALGGGGALGEAAYADQLASNYRGIKLKHDANSAMERASMDRLQRIALEGLGETLAPLGMDQFTGVLQAGQGNAAQLMQSLLGGQEFMGRRAAQDAAAAGDLAGANAALLPLGAPQDLTKISGGVAYNPLGTPDQALQVTPLGESEMALEAARARQADAAARLSGVKADAGGWSPPSTRGTGVNSLGDFVTKEEVKRINAMAAEAAAQPGADPVAIERERKAKIAEVMGGGMLPPQAAAPQPSAPAAAPVVPEGQYTEDDAKELIAAAERAIAAGKDRNEVTRILQANLARMGFSLGN